MDTPDVTVVGSGPNGMAAAVTMARAGLSVHVVERAATIGGGARTTEATLPGYRHDRGSAVHPMALASGFFQKFDLVDRIDLVTPELSYAHPLDSGRAGLAWHDLERTARGLGVDGGAWRSLFAPLVDRVQEVAQFSGSSILQVPRHPLTVALFGLRVLEQGSAAWNLRFRGLEAPALLAGVNAHSIKPMPTLSTAAAGLVLATHGHARGWPVPVGGSQAIIDAMALDLIDHDGRITTGVDVTHVDELPRSRAIIFDTSARAMSRIAASRLPDRYRSRLARFTYGNGVAKVDFALSAPVPWTNEHVRDAGTVHVGGDRAEIAAGEADVAAGRHPSSSYVLVSQPSSFDPSRAPEGKHVLWAYTHVPRGSTRDMTEAVTAQIERFAPGFRDTILASHQSSAMGMQEYNPNYIGGDIAAGDASIGQLIARPVVSRDPWRTPAAGIYLCSSSSPPGPGVHGLAGYYAARSALRAEFGLTPPRLGKN
ncbi:phytoene desaturase family protein [Marisediminicola sp. LYQ85]|uniref:phytoene desaturase family protein n=1 Tax=Marisediminicola sp. LYQ85 TaxID=3391062 RepID=UPI003982EF9F